MHECLDFENVKKQGLEYSGKRLFVESKELVISGCNSEENRTGFCSKSVVQST
jgi:hypothetical protein